MASEQFRHSLLITRHSPFTTPMLLTIHPDNPDPRKIAQVVECLKKGGVVVYPTDTVYSMGCDMLNSKALERLALIKQVKLEKANFSLVCHDLSHLTEYSKQLSNPIYKLMRSVLPGPYTFILEASKAIPKIFSDRKKTVGIRVPDNAIARAIVEALGNPIVSTSVHDDDALLEYTTDPELIHEKWSNRVDLVIDGGTCGLEPSTIISCINDEIEVLRVGKGSVDTI
jgi:tRNA threonylcarbamoyl adenosine modification protein (Sua5/YciO/YrdC/YwlC family)